MPNLISPTKEILKGETTDAMESVIFTNILSKSVGKSKYTEIKPYLDLVAFENNMRLKRNFTKVRNIFFKSVVCN